MSKKINCPECQRMVVKLQERCRHCGFNIIVEPNEKARVRYLRGPSLGALLFTQGWALGSRQYLLFMASLIPIVGVAALIIGVIFGRRLAWKFGGWLSWEEYQRRMKLLDKVGIVWVVFLLIIYLFARFD